MKLNSLTTTLSTIALTATALIGIAGQAQAITFAGTSAGEFGNPLTPDPTSVYSVTSQGIGTNNRLTWGTSNSNSTTVDAGSNYVQYDGVGFSTELDAAFNVGDLTYFNGATFNSFDGDFPLDITLNIASPGGIPSTTYDFNFNILNTSNTTGNPVLDGDKLQFSAALSPQTFNYNGVSYTLQLLGFSTNGGDNILTEFNSPENSTANASLYAKITADPTQSVPEPATIAGLGLLGIYLVTRRQGHKAQAAKVLASLK